MILENRGLLGQVDPRVKLFWVIATLIAALPTLALFLTFLLAVRHP